MHHRPMVSNSLVSMAPSPPGAYLLPGTRDATSRHRGADSRRDGARGAGGPCALRTTRCAQDGHPSPTQETGPRAPAARRSAPRYQARTAYTLSCTHGARGTSVHALRVDAPVVDYTACP